VITGLTPATPGATVSRPPDRKHTAPGLWDVIDDAAAASACQVWDGPVAAPADRPRLPLTGHPVIRFTLGGHR